MYPPENYKYRHQYLQRETKDLFFQKLRKCFIEGLVNAWRAA
jgi:hypothetical protein